jgi:hypothetical protein
MDAREQRGLAISQQFTLVKKGGIWLVPSASEPGKKYIVSPDKEAPHCSCPDFEKGHHCKHLFAVEFTMTKTESNSDGTTTVTTLSVKAERKTYAQPNWPAYHASQVHEREHFHELLAELCAMLPDTPRKPGRGRKPVSYRDGLFSAVLKVYSLMSARRFAGELAEAHDRRYIDRLPHFTSVLNVFDNPDMTPLLKGMIETSAMPLSAVETKFAVDSTGFATIKYASWYDHKWNKIRREARWLKAHFCTGVSTNVVPAVEVLGEDTADNPQLPGLIETTAKSFTMAEVTGDNAYAGAKNFAAVEARGAQFFPAFAKHTTGKIGGSFAKAFHYFCLHRDEYLKHYHLRSNAESTVAMVKRKFGDAVKAKNEVAQRNEVYAKFVAHNICVLIQEMYVQGIEPTFSKPTGPVALKIFDSA